MAMMISITRVWLVELTSTISMVRPMLIADNAPHNESLLRFKPICEFLMVG